MQIAGQRKPMMRVALWPERLRAHGVVVSDVLAALAREHIQLPGGFLSRQTGEALLNLNLEFQNADALGQLVVGSRGDRVVRLRKSMTLRPEEKRAERAVGSTWFGPPT